MSVLPIINFINTIIYYEKAFIIRRFCPIGNGGL